MTKTIDKYKPIFENGTIKKDSNPYAQLLTKVLQAKIDPNCLAVWVSLQSRPDDWILSPEQLRNQFGWGRNKTYQVLNKLIDLMLLERIQYRDKAGKIAHTVYYVQDGQKFLNNQCAHPLPQNQDLDNQDLENRYYTNKRKQQIKENNKDKDIVHLHKQQNAQDTFFDDFWKAYPVKKNKVRTKKIWDRKKCSKIAKNIIGNIQDRIKNDQQWQNKQYIPHPATYLGNELWTDEIIVNSSEEKPNRYKNYTDFTQQRLDQERMTTETMIYE